jgi:hypothetical protein
MGNDCSVVGGSDSCHHRVLLVRPPEVVLRHLGGLPMSPVRTRMLATTTLEIRCWDGEAVPAEDWRDITGNISVTILFLAASKTSRPPTVILDDVRSGSPSTLSIGVLLGGDSAGSWDGIVDEVITMEPVDLPREVFRLMCAVAPHLVHISISRPLRSLLLDVMVHSGAAYVSLLSGQLLVPAVSVGDKDWEGAFALSKSKIFKSSRVESFSGSVGDSGLLVLAVASEVYLMMRFEGELHNVPPLAKSAAEHVAKHIRKILHPVSSQLH